MCGIAGFISPYGLSANVIERMTTLIRHRGPDDEGFVLFKTLQSEPIICGGMDTPSDAYCSLSPYAPDRPISEIGDLPVQLSLGHRRLSIVDLSPKGHQPLCSSDRRYWIVYNGEVYNHVELRTELEACGHNFASHSDTEVILAAYVHWGPQCLHRFNGMWALAIYDTQRQELFLARDRFGVKPLYWTLADGGFAFASEIKALQPFFCDRPKANITRLLDFLIWNISDHTSETMFEGVMQLPAGHALTIDLKLFLANQGQEKTAIRPHRWYKLVPNIISKKQDASSMLRELLTDSVSLRLRSDVPLGSCLSGGLDSSTIVSLMGGQLKNSGVDHLQKTFTACSHDAEFDESVYARAVIDSASVDGRFITPDPKRLFDDLDHLAWHQDEPFGSTSIFAQWCVFDAAKTNGVTVMLDGQGADEILGGYRGFFGAYLAGLVRQGKWLAWLRELKALRSEIGFSALRSVGYTAAYLFPSLLGVIGRFDNRAYSDQGWINAKYRSAFIDDPLNSCGGRAGSVREMSLAQISATNLPMLLRWEDRNSMAFSVEARVPFLDYRIVEFCLGLDDEQKVGQGISKSILRQSMRGVVPDLILDRKDKMGFVTAEKLWATRDMAARFRQELIDSVQCLSGVVDASVIERFDEVLAGSRPFDFRYWRVISAGRWAKLFGLNV